MPYDTGSVPGDTNPFAIATWNERRENDTSEIKAALDAVNDSFYEYFKDEGFLGLEESASERWKYYDKVLYAVRAGGRCTRNRLY